MVPTLLVLCVIGAYAGNNAISDILIVVGFGIVGYFFRKPDFPLTPRVIALVLGPLAEDNMRRAPLLSDGNFATFVTRTISAVFLLISLLTISWPTVKRFAAEKRSG